MKAILFVLFFLVIVNCSSYGQWYNKKYHVSDIDLLSEQQLRESLKDSKNSLLGSMIVSGLGFGICLLAENQQFDLPDHPTLLEQLMGKKGANDMAYVIGACMVVGGIGATISFEGRIGKIKSLSAKKQQWGLSAFHP